MTITPEQAQELLAGATPGPWHVGPRSTATPSNFAETAILSADGCCPAVALELPPETVANARLIAAAPDLARTVIALRAQLAAADKLAEAATAIADEICDYMKINQLGDGEQKHNVKWVRSTVTAYQDAGK